MNEAPSGTCFGVVAVRNFALQAALRHCPEPPGQPVALVGGAPPARVLEACALAHRAGVRPGMSSTEACAHSPGLLLKTTSENACKSAAAVLMEWTLRISPWVEQTKPGMCTWRWKKEPHPLPDLQLERLRTLGLQATVGIAPNPALAALAALAAQTAHWVDRVDRVDGVDGVDGVDDGAHAHAVHSSAPPRTQHIHRVLHASEVAHLPLQTLNPPPALLPVLHQWGLRTLGDLATMERSTLLERLGSEAGPLWEEARGIRDRPLRCELPEEGFTEAMELEAPLEVLEPLLFVLRRLLGQLTLRMEGVWLAVSTLHLRLRMACGPAHERSFQLPAPTRDPDLLLRLLHTHLEQVRTEQPIVAVELEAVPSRPLREQFALFEGALRDPHQFSETLDRLAALLGCNRTGIPQREPSHHPDRIRMLIPTGAPAVSDTPPLSGTSPTPYGPALRRFRPPIPAHVSLHPGENRPHQVDSPTLSGRVAASSGPWCLSGHWWDSASWRRREWDVQMEGGLLCRLLQEPEGWFVEGVYD